MADRRAPSPNETHGRRLSLLKIVLAYDPELVLAERVAAVPLTRQVEVVHALDDPLIVDRIAGATVLFSNTLPMEALPRAEGLRWIQTPGAGVDRLLTPALTPALLERGIRVTNTSGAFDTQIAEHVLSLMLAFARGLPSAFEAQAAGRWHPVPIPQLRELDGALIGIAGLGRVGMALAGRARALGLRVVGLDRRQGRFDDSELDALGIEEVFEPSAFERFLATPDFVVNALPLTTQTKHLFDARAFGLMSRGAIFINVGRGRSVSEGALVAALRDGEIAGAGLDVVDDEPLASDSPLWHMHNVLLTAHYAGWSPGMHERIYEIFLDNLVRFDRGCSLTNVVDLIDGY